MSIADMSAQHEHEHEHEHERERSPKRRRLDSDSPNSSSRNDLDKYTRRHLTSELPQNGTSNISTPQDQDTPQDGDDGDTGGYAFDDEDESNEQTPEEAEAEGPPGRPTALQYKLHMILKGHKRGVAAVRYSPNGKFIASASADCTIKIWDAVSGKIAHNLEGHIAGVSTLCWNPDSTVLASGSDDKTIRLWNITTGKCLPTPLVGHHNYVYSLAFSPKGNMLVSGSYDEAVFLWDVRTARIMRSLPAHSDPVSGVDFVRDGTLVASCSSDGLIRIWDSTTGQCLKTLVHEDNAPVTSVRFSPNGKFVLATTLDSCVRLWNYVEGRCVKTYQGHKNQKFSINACFGTYDAEGDEEREEHSRQTWAFIACGDEEGRTVIWDVSSKEVLQVLPGHEAGPVLGVDVSPLTGAIATCGNDGTVKVWRRSRPKQSRAVSLQRETGSIEGDDR